MEAAVFTLRAAEGDGGATAAVSPAVPAAAEELGPEASARLVGAADTLRCAAEAPGASPAAGGAGAASELPAADGLGDASEEGVLLLRADAARVEEAPP